MSLHLPIHFLTVSSVLSSTCTGRVVRNSHYFPTPPPRGGGSEHRLAYASDELVSLTKKRHPNSEGQNGQLFLAFGNSRRFDLASGIQPAEHALDESVSRTYIHTPGRGQGGTLRPSSRGRSRVKASTVCLATDLMVDSPAGTVAKLRHSENAAGRGGAQDVAVGRDPGSSTYSTVP